MWGNKKEVDGGIVVTEEIGGYAPNCDYIVADYFTYTTFKEYAEYIKKKLSYRD